MPNQQSRRAFLTSASAAAATGVGVGGAVGAKLFAGKGLVDRIMGSIMRSGTP